MGASLAKALKKYAKCQVYGHDINKYVEQKALSEKVADRVGLEVLCDADIVVVALYPEIAAEFLKNNCSYFKKNCVVTDLCGLKTEICNAAQKLKINFCGSHPMRGREVSGYDASTEDLFVGGNWIFTPFDKNESEDSVPKILLDMARCVGAGNIVITTPERHDEIIAYTSELPHIIAPSYIENELFGDHYGFCGGSFEDITRVATLNAEMWSEIFCTNKDNIVKILNGLINSLENYKKLIADGDIKALSEKLAAADAHKRHIDECRGKNKK